MIQIFHTVCKRLNIASSLRPLTPLDRNPNFPPGIMHPDSINTHANHSVTAESYFDKGKLLSFQTLSSRFPDMDIPFFNFLQIRHFLLSFTLQSQWCRAQTSFEAIHNRSEPQRHVISGMYSLLFAKVSAKDDVTSQKWERELATDLTQEEGEPHLYPYKQRVLECLHTGKWI